MSSSTPLSEAVSEIDENARAKQNAEKIDQKITVARTLISNLNADIDTLADDVQELQFYREILDRAFGVSPPGDASITEARLAVDKNRERLIQDLVEGGLDIDDDAGQISGGPEFESYKADIQEAQRAVSRDIDVATSKLETKKNEWVDKLDSAESLQRIIGSQNDDFANTIQWLRRLVTKDMFNPNKSATSVVQEWERAKERWEGSEGLHGKESYQKEKGLSSETMDEIERLSRQSSVELAEIDTDVISELKSVPELSEAVELSI
jgi:hypothetical protein